MTIQVLQQAEKLFRSGERRAAIDLLEEHMAQSPGDRQAASVLGRIYIKNSQPDQAAFWLKHALQKEQPYADPAVKPIPSDPVFDQNDLDFMSSDTEAEEYNFNDAYGLLNETLGDAPRELKKADVSERLKFKVPAVRPVTGLPPTPALTVGSEPAGELFGTESSADYEVYEDFGVNDDLEDVFDAAVDAVGDIDWQEYALDEDLIDTVEEDPVEEVTVSRLSTLERARQVAARLAAEADWSKKQVPVLIEVLAVHKSHGKTVAALERLLLEDGVTPGELGVMHELRLKWGGSGYNRDYRANEATDGWPNVSWEQSLRLLRCLNAESADELILFIDDCFDDWCRDEGLLQAYPKFVYYLDRVVENANGVALVTAERVAPFVDYALFYDEEGYYDAWRKSGTKLPHYLQLQGLIGDEEFVN